LKEYISVIGYTFYREENDAGIIPTSIKLRKITEGTYILAQYIEAEDGTGFAPSIKAFCKLKSGVADEILSYYGE